MNAATNSFAQSLFRPLRALPVRDHNTQLRQRLLGLCVMILLAVLIIPWGLKAVPRESDQVYVATFSAKPEQSQLSPAAGTAVATPPQAGPAQPPSVPAPHVDALSQAPISSKPAPTPMTATTTTTANEKPDAVWAILHARFRSEEATREPKNRLATLRLPVMVLPQSKGSERWWNVWVGPFLDEGSVRQADALLKRKQIPHEKPRLLKRKRK